jgi:ABC-type branched-subunit amino acid transport system substrate-binding protein
MAGVEAALKVQPYLQNGDKIEVVLRDDKSDAMVTVAAAKDLVSQEKVAAMLVLSRSSSVLALSDVVDELETPFLALISSHPSITKSKWASQLMFDDENQGIISALYVRDELLMESVVVFRQVDDPHSVFLADKFALKFKESGGDVLVIDIVGTQVDFTEIFNQVEPRYQNFFYSPVDANHVLQIEKTARELDLKPQMMVSDGVAGNVLLQFEEDVKLLNGMMAVDVFSTNAKKTDFGRLMAESFKQNFREPGTTFAALGCEGISYLAAVMQKCGDPTDKICISKTIRSYGIFVGFSGAFHVRMNGKVERPVYINLVENAKLRSLVKIYSLIRRW